MKRLTAFFALVILPIQPVDAAIIEVACDANAISNACVSTAQEGDTILIGPGSTTLNGQIWIDRNISFNIVGSGTNQTQLISGNQAQIFFWFSNGSNTVTISDLDCVGHANNGGGFFLCGWSGKQNLASYRFTRIQMTNILSRGISIGAGGARGLIDHCTFISATNGAPQHLDFRGDGYNAWTNSNPLGTTNVVCVEDCYLKNAQGHNGNGLFDAYNGAQFVFRYNVCDGSAPTGAHGYDSQPTSVRTSEIYWNRWTNTSQAATLELRGGVSIVFSNTISSSSGSPIIGLHQYYRSCTDAGPNAVDAFGIPGQGRVLSFSDQPTNGQRAYYGIGTLLGLTPYTFTNSYSNAGYDNTYGGGDVVIGATLADSMTNLYNAINRGDGSGVTYAASGDFGHDWIAIGVTATSVILTNLLDSNSNEFGWPANQQTGVLKSYPLTGTNFINEQVLFPSYSWSNTVDGVRSVFEVYPNTAACSYYVTNLIKLDRDYYEDAIPPAETYSPLVYPHPLAVAATVLSPRVTGHLRGSRRGPLR